MTANKETIPSQQSLNEPTTTTGTTLNASPQKVVKIIIPKMQPAVSQYSVANLQKQTIRPASTGKLTETSRFQKIPGSSHSKRTDYPLRMTTFHDMPVADQVKKQREQVKDWKENHRIGKTPQWNTSVYTNESVCTRPMERQISIYQSEKMEYNYRADEIYPIYHDTIFISKSNKFEVDKEPFLKPEDKKKVIRKNVTYRKELVKLEEQKKLPWNNSAELNAKALKHQDDMFLTLSKSTSAKRNSKYLSNYLTPVELETLKQESIRDEKRNVKQYIEDTTHSSHNSFFI